jgi:hypothetical protein
MQIFFIDRKEEGHVRSFLLRSFVNRRKGKMRGNA